MTIANGAIARNRTFTLRTATRDDLLRLEKRRQQGIPKKLRYSHHLICLYAALGFRNKDIAERTGYSVTRINTILASPSAEHLVAEKQKEIGSQHIETAEAYLVFKHKNMVTAERQLSDRLDEMDENGELLSVREALAISADGADRLGYGKKQTNVNVNIDYGARLDQRMARINKVIDGSLTSSPPALEARPVPSSTHHTPSVAASSPSLVPSSQQTPSMEQPQPLLRRI